MRYTIKTFGTQVHDILAIDGGPAGREKVRLLLENALNDEAFIAAHLSDDAPARQTLYEDPGLGFLVFGYVFREVLRELPHDHGPTWAIFGQAAGITHMSEWEVVEPAGPERPGKVRLAQRYDLHPGDARTYNEGVLHSPWSGGAGKVVQIQGGPIDRASRLTYEPV
jgi:hypothetical protein